MCLKAYFKTNGEVKGVPIYTPFNQLHIQTGNGYVEDYERQNSGNEEDMEEHFSIWVIAG